MTIRDILNKFESYCDCEEYHIHYDMPEDHIIANADPNDGHVDFDIEEAQKALESLLKEAERIAYLSASTWATRYSDADRVWHEMLLEAANE